MISRLIRGQLTVFAVVAVLAIGWTLVSYARVPQLLGLGEYHVTVDLPNASGLYPNALVTYRGVDIGRVHSIDITPRGVAARLLIDDGRTIPANSIARVGSRSAIGEQYIDLIPPPNPGPPITDGQSITEPQTRLPIPTGTLVRNVDALVHSVPQGPLHTVLTELYQGFNGRGDDLGTLISSSDALVRSADGAVGSTRVLLNDLQPVLDTQRQLAPTTQRLLGDLADLTTTVRTSDTALRGILDRGPGFADQTHSLVDQLAPSLPPLLDNLTNVGDVTRLYRPSIEQILVVYPAFTAALQTALLTGPGDTVQLSARTNIDDPRPCTIGYPGTQRDPRQTTMAPVKTGLYCRASAQSQQAVRGARNIPCPNNPFRRAATPEGCGLDFRDKTDPDKSPNTQTHNGQQQPTANNPTPGIANLPDDQSFTDIIPGMLGKATNPNQPGIPLRDAPQNTPSSPR